MKRLNLLIPALFIALCSFAQSNTNDLNAGPNEQSIMINKTGEQVVPTASTVQFGRAQSAGYEGEYHRDRCDSYHKMKVAGIVLSAAGGGMIIIGSVIMNRGYEQNYDGTISRDHYYAMENFGGAMIGLGTVSVAAGIPLAIIGSVKGHKYCGAGGAHYSSYLELNSGEDGTGLALKF